MIINKIVSGGQTGADQAALDVAIRLGIPYGGWVPKGRISEDGILPHKYKLQEIPKTGYPKRTERNILESNGTLVISHGALRGGLTIFKKLAEKHERPYLHIDLDQVVYQKAALKIAIWIMKNKIVVLNVAGPRASKDPKIYQAVLNVLESAMHLCSVQNFPPRYKKPDTDSDSDIIGEILGKMPLREKSSIANMEKDQVETLQSVFDMYIRSKIGSDSSEGDFDDIIVQLWDRLKKTHRLRSVK